MSCQIVYSVTGDYDEVILAADRLKLAAFAARELCRRDDIRFRITTTSPVHSTTEKSVQSILQRRCTVHCSEQCKSCDEKRSHTITL